MYLPSMFWEVASHPEVNIFLQACDRYANMATFSLPHQFRMPAIRRAGIIGFR